MCFVMTRLFAHPRTVTIAAPLEDSPKALLLHRLLKYFAYIELKSRNKPVEVGVQAGVRI